MLALHSWIVKIPPHGNDFLSVAKLTYCEREREKKKDRERGGGKKGKKKRRAQRYKPTRMCACVKKEVQDNRADTFSHLSISVAPRALYPRVYQATSNYGKSFSSAIFQGN